MRSLRCLIAVWAFALLAGCSTTTPATPTPAAENGGTPNQPFVVPTPASDQVGVVTGKLTNTAPQGDPAIYRQGIRLFLGSILVSDQGHEGLVSLDRTSAPQTVTDPDGNFAFADVPPGRYGLWLDSPTAPLLLNHPDTGEDFIIEVQAGQVVDLGDLGYELPF